MVDYRAKFDSTLFDIHASYLALQRGDSGTAAVHPVAERGSQVSVLLHYNGDLAGIEARGFRTEWVEGDFARGDVTLDDLEAVASHHAVIQLEYGTGLKLMLDTSVVEIRARGPVWTVNQTSGQFAGHRGAGVVIGVIDTGIDIHHPVFMKAGSSNSTRVRRIWDMGIAPHDGIPSPDAALLRSGFTYGVEYTDAMIDAVLQKKPGAKPVKHEDCNGHGTHVASIAAGDGRAVRSKKRYEFVGVAPAADLVVVKLLYLKQEPTHGGSTVNHERLLEDAISYIENVTRTRLGGRPVVVNVSLGWDTGPHDGLSARDQWLEAHFRNATGRALVVAAGNQANGRQRALITIPASGQISVPFTLYDERHARTDRNHCEVRANARPELEIEFWYPQLGPAQTLTSALTPPGATAPTNGPPLPGSITGKYRSKWEYVFSHQANAAQRPPATPVTRNVLRIKVLVRNNSYGTGRFTLRLNGPAGTVVHAWANQFWPDHGFRMGHDQPNTKPPSMAPLPAGMTTPNSATVGYPATSAGAIAVANYNDRTGALAASSSQGPLADYSGLGPYVPKPDLAAPGDGIEAANGRATVLGALVGRAGNPYAEYGGTSMAAPHVAGVGALMFEKKNNLSLADLAKELTGRARPPSTANTFGAGKVDAKRSRDAV